ncbi:restriction endonuclease subunit S [Streptococcus macedonicus]|uniref:Restriction endonuclease subunit S n=1 Tax=Streptococcus macedonicus TaxID=59310 RepID=A0AAP8KDD8_STRMC|nr:restriction endonuclease subunit S [Streptococcus macedonicus]PHV58930.1 restriction endonuclease subunit S [Streptococcus macedonicus]
MSEKATKIPQIRFDGYTDAWEQRKAGEIFKSVSDKGYTDLPVLSASQELGMILRDEIGIDIKYDESSIKNYKRVKPGQFVIHLRSFQGGFAWSDIEGITSPAYTILDYQDPEEHCSKFWKIVLTSPMFITRLETVTYGIRDGRSISFTDFSTLNLNVPSIAEQQKIGEYFSKLDNLITLHQRECDLLAKMKKSYLQKMFPKNGEDKPEIRFAGFTDAWEQRMFEKFAQRQSNTMISNPDNPCIEYEDVISEQGILNKDVCSKDAEKNGIIFTEEDILYGKLRPYLHNWLNPDFKGVAVGDWWVLRPINMDKNFLYWLIQTPQYDNAANQSSGTKMPRADWKLVSNTDFYVPISNEEQAKIAGLFEKINTLITLHQRELDSLKKMKKSLLQMMFV